MRSHLLVICAAGATVAAALAVLPQAGAQGAPVIDAPNQSTPSPCTVTHTKTASPNVLLLGETVGVTITVEAHCPREHFFPVHIVLVLDGSETMSGQKKQHMRQSATSLIRALSMTNHPWIKTGVVEFNDQARRLCGLTNGEDRAIGCVNRVGATGGTRIDLGIREGLRVITFGRSGLNRDELTETMIVMSDGGNDAGCAPVLSAARQVKRQDVLVLSVCVGNDCDEQCMRQVASGPSNYHRVEDALWHLVVDPRRASSLWLRVRHLVVRDTLPDWMEYVPESADPPQSSPDDPGRWLRWEDTSVPTSGATYTFKARPLRTGYMPVNTEATGELTDNMGRSKAWVFEQPWVTVLDPALLPTSEPTSTPIATPSSTPSPTATPSVRSLHLPRVLRRE